MVTKSDAGELLSSVFYAVKEILSPVRGSRPKPSAAGLKNIYIRKIADESRVNLEQFLIFALNILKIHTFSKFYHFSFYKKPVFRCEESRKSPEEKRQIPCEPEDSPLNLARIAEIT